MDSSDSDSDSDVILIDSDDGSGGRRAAAASRDASTAPSSVSVGIGRRNAGGGGSVVDVDADSRVDSADDGDRDDSPSSSSSSSSSSSGFPSPWRTRRSSPPSSDRPPSVIHAKSPTATAASRGEEASEPTKAGSGEDEAGKPSRKKCLTNGSETIERGDDDETSRADASTTTSPPANANDDAQQGKGQSKETKRPTTKQTRKPKKRQWGWNRKKAASKETDGSGRGEGEGGDSSSSSAPPSAKTKPAARAGDEDDAAKHFHCYLLRSLDPDHPLKTYIGFTTNPQRRIRQHNGVLKAGGAKKTKRSGRPWTFVCVVHGFQDKITALQFEWAWQNVDKSLNFREAVGDDMLAKKMKRRHSPKARLDELRILLTECLPFCLYSLTVYFPEREYHNTFGGMVKRGKDGNPYKSDTKSYKRDESEPEACGALSSYAVCSLEDMPFAREMVASRERKKSKRDAKRESKKTRKDTEENGEATREQDCGIDISEWLENARAAMEEESCLSDLLDDDDEGSKCSDLKTIDEDESSVEPCGGGGNDGRTSPVDRAEGTPLDESSGSCHADADDISKDFLSLSINPSKGRAATTRAKECDYSTISSCDSTPDCSVVDNPEFLPEGAEKENQRPSRFDVAYTSANNDVGNAFAKGREVVDLCDSP